jgi:LytS/YehU family sensor histidine kinase
MELSKEVDFAENYIFLIQTRFTKDYDFNIIKNTSLDNKFIPTGALQALLENVVKHNKSQNNVTVNSKILIDEDWLTIINKKANFKQSSESLGTGLENLKSRYKLLSDQEVQIINTENEFKVSIPIIKLSKDL